MATIKQWSGREVRALREARRMSIRDFADHLGVSHRMISKWEAGGESITPRPMNQSALDTSLAKASDAERARFVQFVDQQILTLAPEQAIQPARETHVRHPSDGKLMALVDAGVFLCGPANTPTWLPAFFIDVHPVTNADYALFVRATDHRAPAHWGHAGVPADLANHPVVYVDWNDSHSYATWAQKGLASTEQWEKSARGPRGSIYPWGDQVTPAKCNVRELGPGTTTPVDRYQSGTSIYGVFDLCGNVWEWTGSVTTPGRYELKGSAFTSGFERATPSNFNDAAAIMFDDDTGFRCVISAEDMNALLSA